MSEGLASILIIIFSILFYSEFKMENNCEELKILVVVGPSGVGKVNF
jgi:flagellar biosynthesis GTPase FlhF